MKKRMSHYEFLSKFQQVNPTYYSKVEILTDFKCLRCKMLLKDEYGILETFPSTLLQGCPLSIRSAKNKTDYFKNFIKSVNKHDIEIIGEYIGKRNTRIDCLYKGKIYNSQASSLVQGHKPTQLKFKEDKEVKIKKFRGFSEDYYKNKLENINNNEYSFIRLTEGGVSAKIIGNCSIHGVFEVNKGTLRNGGACKKCSFFKRRRTTEEFIADSILTHGIKYDYSKSVYVTAHKHITIICKQHGEFRIKPCAHLRGNGCAICGHILQQLAYTGSTDKDASKITCNLYIVNVYNQEESFYKIGISKNLNNRFNSRKIDYKFKLIYQKEMSLIDAINLEQLILKRLKEYKYFPKQNFGGKTECLNTESLKLIQELVIKKQ